MRVPERFGQDWSRMHHTRRGHVQKLQRRFCHQRGPHQVFGCVIYASPKPKYCPDPSCHPNPNSNSLHSSQGLCCGPMDQGRWDHHEGHCVRGLRHRDVAQGESQGEQSCRVEERCVQTSQGLCCGAMDEDERVRDNGY